MPIRRRFGSSISLKRRVGSGDFQGVHVDTTNNEIFVADRSGGGNIIVYGRTANGPAAPLRTLAISGEPRGVSVDAGAGELYVSRSGQVLTFARAASGPAAPLRTIAPLPSLGDMSQLTFDAARSELVVANHGWDAIRVWPRAANGPVSPTRSIIGSNTLLDSPRGVAVCSDGVYLATARYDDQITVYAAGASDNTAPLRTIGGAATQLSSPRFIAVTGGPCDAAVAATPIPVLSPLGLLTLTALLGMLGIHFVRRQLS